MRCHECHSPTPLRRVVSIPPPKGSTEGLAEGAAEETVSGTNSSLIVWRSEQLSQLVFLVVLYGSAKECTLVSAMDLAFLDLVRGRNYWMGVTRNLLILKNKKESIPINEKLL